MTQSALNGHFGIVAANRLAAGVKKTKMSWEMERDSKWRL